MVLSTRQPTGFCLSELLVAMALGGLAVAAMLRIYSHALAAQATVASVTDLAERGAFVLAELERDILLAGYFGHSTAEQAIDSSAAGRIRCSGTDVTDWALQTELPVYADPELPCPAAAVSAGSDILTIRRVSTASASARSGTVQLEHTPAGGRLFADGSPVTSEPVHDLRIHSWYVGSRSSEPGMSALRRLTLTHGGTMQSQEIMPGIEQLQVQFAVDSDNDAVADSMLSPAQLRATSDPVVGVRIELLVRAAEFDAANGEADGHRRLRFSRLLKLRNRRSAS